MKHSSASCTAGAALCIGLALAASGCGGQDTHSTEGGGGSTSTTPSTTDSGGSGGTGGTGGGTAGTTGSGGVVQDLAPTLYVAHEGAFAAYDIATGTQVGTPIEGVSKPYGMQALDDGSILTNLTATNETLVVDGHTVTELGRTPSSLSTGTRPVDSYISNDLGGSQYWLLMNDGNQTAGTSTATLVDITVGSATRFERIGEVPLGNGHHQAAFSAKGSRFVASSFTDCDNVISVLDFTDPTTITTELTITALDIGLDGSTTAKTCDPTESAGVSPRPHGCAASKASGKVYCNVAGLGLLVMIDPEADPPTFTTLQTSGTGGGYVKAGKLGNYLYTVQANPREGSGGADCQVGQMLTIDASTDAVVHEMPIFYKGPGCTDVLTGTDEETDSPNHIRITPDGKHLFIALAGGFGVDTARVRQHIAVDLADPAAPVQLPSIPVGQSSAQRGSAISGDGLQLFVADTIDGTVTVIDTGTLEVTQTITVMASPLQVATFGDVQGPSLQIGPVH